MTRFSRRLLCFALAFLMAAAVLPAVVPGHSAKADSATLGKTTVDQVNFRVGPSMRDPLLFRVARNTVCKVLRKVTANGYEWYEVTAKDPDSGYTREYTGYLRGDCFRMLTDSEEAAYNGAPENTVTMPPNTDTTAPTGAIGTVNNYGVNFRVAPWRAVITQFDKGEQVTVLTVPSTISRETWYYVDHNGTRGYIMSVYLDYNGAGGATPAPGTTTPTPTPKPSGSVTPAPYNPTNPDILGYVMTTKGSVNVRASIGGTSLKQVGIYETYPYLLAPVKRGNYTWYFVQVNSSLKGYIRGDCVKVVKGPAATPTPSGGGSPVVTATPTVVPAQTPTGYLKTTMDDVNVRKGIWGDRITVVKKAGTVFPYYGEPKQSGKTLWYYIKGDFGYAWIHGGYIKVTAEDGGTITPTPEPPATPTPTGGGTTPIDTGTVNEASYTTLRPGSSGLAVQNLVTELKNQGYFKGTITSKYNSAVENAVRAFQKAKGLAVDGIAGNDTQHALFHTVPIGSADYTNLSMTLYVAEKIDWNTGGIDELWPRGSNFKIYDVYTGIVFWAHRWAGGLHVDAEPLTKADTERICKIWGVSKASEIKESTHWQRRPALVTIGTRTFACSLYLVPHNPEGDTIPDNNFTGQFCIHFTNSKVHGSGKVDSGHMEAIEYAWQNAPNGHK